MVAGIASGEMNERAIIGDPKDEQFTDDACVAGLACASDRVRSARGFQDIAPGE